MFWLWQYIQFVLRWACMHNWKYSSNTATEANIILAFKMVCNNRSENKFSTENYPDQITYMSSNTGRESSLTLWDLLLKKKQQYFWGNLSKPTYFWILKEQVTSVMVFSLSSFSTRTTVCKHCKSPTNSDNINTSPMTHVFNVMFITVNSNVLKGTLNKRTCSCLQPGLNHATISELLY